MYLLNLLFSFLHFFLPPALFCFCFVLGPCDRVCVLCMCVCVCSYVQKCIVEVKVESNFFLFACTLLLCLTWFRFLFSLFLSLSLSLSLFLLLLVLSHLPVRTNDWLRDVKAATAAPATVTSSISFVCCLYHQLWFTNVYFSAHWVGLLVVIKWLLCLLACLFCFVGNCNLLYS